MRSKIKKLIKHIKRNNTGGLPRSNIISVGDNFLELKDEFPTEISRIQDAVRFSEYNIQKTGDKTYKIII